MQIIENYQSTDLVGKGIAIGAEGMGFDSRAGPIASGSPPLRPFFGAVAEALNRGNRSRHLFTLRRNTASEIKRSVVPEKVIIERFSFNS